MPKLGRMTPTKPQPQAGRPTAPQHITPKVGDERALAAAYTVPIDQIQPDPDQPRKHSDNHNDKERLTELADSLKQYGVLQPLLVRDVGLLDDGRTRYMVVAGGRRYAAALLAGLTRLPVVVKDTEGAALRLTQLVENIQRQNLSPLDEARAFQEIMDAEDIKPERLAARLHVSGQTVRDRLLLLSDQRVADAVQRGQVAPTVARDLMRMADEPQDILRARVEAGEKINNADIQRARQQAAATGVTNVRAKGGGRTARNGPREIPAVTPTPPSRDHKTYDNRVTDARISATPAPSQTVIDSLDEAVRMLDGMVVDVMLHYGIERDWTCQQLLEAIQQRRSPATS